MLSDYRVVTLLLTQLFSAILLFQALWFSVKVILHWREGAATEVQLRLERQSYLVSTLVQAVLFFQLLSLFVFIHTVNQHLPELIDGAMCAVGTLRLNSYGYPLLYLKCLAIFIYLSYLFLHFLDHSEPNYPLTPAKYYLVFPAFTLLISDFVLMSAYFYRIEPDIIATCCSVRFSSAGPSLFSGFSQARYLNPAFVIYWLSFISMGGWLLLSARPFYLFRKKGMYLGIFVVALLFIASALYTLKHFFVKYIYGNPVHTCLFDIFWAKYAYIGYVLFVAYYGLVGSLLFLGIYQFVQPWCRRRHPALVSRLRWVAGLCGLVAFIVPWLYWAAWGGRL